MPQHKRRVRSHIIADLSVNYAERFLLRNGHTVQRVHFDYGYDLFVQTFTDTGELERGFFMLQLKATDSLRHVGTDNVAIGIERRDLLAWRGEAIPVFLILYDAMGDAAYWLEMTTPVLTTLLKSVATTVSVTLPVSNRVSDIGVAVWRDIKNRGLRETL